MKKYLTLLFTALSCATVATVAVANTQLNESQLGETLIPKSIDNTAESVTPAYTNPQKDAGNIPTTFPYQPPLVPHSIRGLQVTKNTNQCLGCHAPDVAQTTGATQIPPSHFKDREGKMTEGSSPLRYFCLQCHVQQADVNPIVQNKFETIREHQGKK